MKKLIIFIMSLFSVLQINAICVPGVGYTLVASVAKIDSKSGGGLEAMMYLNIPGTIQSDVQKNVFNTTIGTDSSLHIDLIPNPTLSSYINLWTPGVCDVEYSKGSNSVNCRAFNQSVSSTASVGSFLKSYAYGHRSFSVNNSDATKKIHVYMPHTKCKNQKEGDDCFLGGSSSRSQPYLNKIDNTVYPASNYYSALMYKWNESKKGFVFPIAPNNSNNTISNEVIITAEKNRIPRYQQGFNFLNSNSGPYIPIASSLLEDAKTSFSSAFIDYLRAAISTANFDELKLVCNFMGNYGPFCSTLITKNTKLTSDYFADILSEKTSIQSFLYNIISCKTASGNCNIPTFQANHVVDNFFDNYFSSIFMQSEIDKTNSRNRYVIEKYCPNGVCQPIANANPNDWNGLHIFSDYSSSMMTLKSLNEKLKSTSEPALVIKEKLKNDNYSLSFVSDCSASNNKVLVDSSAVINSGGSTYACDLDIAPYFTSKCDLNYYKNGKPLGNSVVEYTLSGYDSSNIERVYLQSADTPGGVPENCAVGDPSITSVGSVLFKMLPTGLCGTSSESSSENVESSKEMNFLFVSPGE